MADVELAGRIEQVGEHLFADQGAGRQRRDEMLGRLGENAADIDAAFFQPPDQVERFVGGDAAADDQQDAFGVGDRGGVCVARELGSAAGLLRAGRAFIGRGTQDSADLVLDRAAAAGRAQAQLLLQLLVELADGEGGHRESSISRIS